MKNGKNGKNVLSTRVARLRKRADNSRIYRLLGGRGAAALIMGATLSVGGLTQALDGAHFVIEKDLDSVRVVQQQGKHDTVVADVDCERNVALKHDLVPGRAPTTVP